MTLRGSSLRDTKMLLEDAVRMQSPLCVWGGVADRYTYIGMAMYKAIRAFANRIRSWKP